MILLKEVSIAIMNNLIHGENTYGYFRFPIKFNLFGKHQAIDNAVFDTGC